MRHNDAAQHFRIVQSSSTRIGKRARYPEQKKRRLLAPLFRSRSCRNLPDKPYEPLPADALDR